MDTIQLVIFATQPLVRSDKMILSKEITVMREEFDKSVKASFWYYHSELSEAQVDNYLSCEEAQKVINEEWENSLKSFNNNEITRKQVVEGGGSAAGNCLDMMY